MALDILFNPGIPEERRQKIEADAERDSTRTLKNRIAEIPQEAHQAVEVAQKSVQEFMDAHQLYVPKGFFENMSVQFFDGRDAVFEYADGSTEKDTGGQAMYDLYTDTISASIDLLEKNPKLLTWMLTHEIFHRLQKKYVEHVPHPEGGTRIIQKFGFEGKTETESEMYLVDFNALHEYGTEVSTYLALKNSSVFKFDDTFRDVRMYTVNSYDGIPTGIGEEVAKDLAGIHSVDIADARLMLAKASLVGDEHVFDPLTKLEKYNGFEILTLLKLSTATADNKFLRLVTNAIRSFMQAKDDAKRKEWYGVIKDYLKQTRIKL